MKFYSVEYWQENWETLMERVENGETIGVENENGERAVMVPADDELIRLYTEHEEGSWGGLAIWWMQQTHNLPKVSSILTTPIDGSPSNPYNTKVNKQENDTD